MNIIKRRLEYRGFKVKIEDYGANWILLLVNGFPVRVVWLEETNEVIVSSLFCPKTLLKEVQRVVKNVIFPRREITKPQYKGGLNEYSREDT
ncbi:MAG TPA: hypothetical protein EYH40_04650 [Desulfurococcales archaeon]|nr:hypothetical protein [Desulfurococcales archaeon]